MSIAYSSSRQAGAVSLPATGLVDGEDIYDLARRIFPICRSITGNGVRETLDILRGILPELKTVEVPTGTRCFDWTIPKEWNIRDAYILNESGERIVDFADSNLHVMNYSVPVDAEMELDDLQPHLYSIPDQPDAIPYVTSYYKERWGFCLTENQRRRLKPGRYRVRIDSRLEDGHLSYGELRLPGQSTEEVLLSTYVCHPSMANNEVSGPCVTAFLARWLMGQANRKYSYRILFLPETIGAIAYLSRHLAEMQQRVIAGFNVTCVGDDRTYSYLPSRAGDTLTDNVITHVLEMLAPDYERYSFLDRGSDERQYCSPNVDLPVASLMRSKYDTYPEYHTSLDDLTLISPAGLFGSYQALLRCIQCVEQNCRPRCKMPCEPQLGKRGLYPDLSRKGSSHAVKRMMDLLAYSDGQKTLLEIARTINVPVWELTDIVETLKTAGVLEVDEL